MADLEIAAFVEARAAEDETWAHEASLLDEDAGYVPGGVHWHWTDSYGNALRLDPATMAYVGQGVEGVILESVETRQTRSVGELPQLAIQGAYEVAVPIGVHIARHDPARVLRDVAAIRERLRLLRIAWNAHQDSQRDREPFEAFARGDATGRFAMALRMVALDAAIWRDHPGYQARWADPGWRPEPGSDA